MKEVTRLRYKKIDLVDNRVMYKSNNVISFTDTIQTIFVELYPSDNSYIIFNENLKKLEHGQGTSLPNAKICIKKDLKNKLGVKFYDEVRKKKVQVP